MSAGANDKFTKSYSFLQKSLGATINDAASSLTLNNYTNIPTDTKVHFIIDRIDSNGNRTNSARELVSGISTGSAITNLSRGLHGTTAQSHDAGAVVEFVLSGAAWNDLIDGLLVEHNQDGTHSAVTATSVTTDILENTNGAWMPVGSILDYAGSSAPGGWLFCYGQAISRTTYSALFTAIGTTYGVGDGSTTFNLPDLRGRVVAGKDDMGGSSADRLTDQSGGLDGDVLGDTGGAETHTLTTTEMPSHTHTYTRYTALTTNTAGGSTNTWNGTGSQSSGSTGGDGAHNNVQPTIILNKIIKY